MSASADGDRAGQNAQAPVRATRLGDCRAVMEKRSDGSLIVRNVNPVGPFPAQVSSRLDHWAKTAPDRIWLAERDSPQSWRRVTYAQARSIVRAIASALLKRNLSVERPVVILSGNSIDHAMLGMGAMYAGIAYAPVSPAYSLISSDHSKLKYIFDLITPGMIYVEDGGPFARAIENAMPRDCELVIGRNAPKAFAITPYEELISARDDALVDAANSKVTPDTIAKFLFTSGSTGMPKAVINTQLMLCSNMAMISDHFDYLKEGPPVTLDWSPWNHTAGGNHDFNLVLHHGGTMYIDDGKPVPGGVEATVRNLREVSPNWYFNVPKGYDALVPFLRAEKTLRENFFKHLGLFWYAGAGMSQHTWDALDEMAYETCGERILVLTGLGSTETAPFAMAANQTMVGAGHIGTPARGTELKLVPSGEKWEARFRGPHITPGYWRQAELTAKAFDEEGFYCIGDALRFVDPDDVNKGFLFDGRIAEDFKLNTGTWVAVGPLRTGLIDHFAPLVQDAVIAGLNQDYLGALIFPDLNACRKLTGDAQASLKEIAAHPMVRAAMQEKLASFSAAAIGSSNRVRRIILLEQGPDIDKSEMTD
ncbi:MAG: feruloyl-CoA synthase, partial [Alphaproteobacteria bacterium]|nr:feruloyl-CoA synthase [Alphaproteobacteria bacterium]